jgi:hypothetical protein
VRRRARKFIEQLDAIGDDWEAADLLWHDIESWTNANPAHSREFLRVFRVHHRGKRAVFVNSGPSRILRTL